MITEKELAVVRAALQFLDEEMSPSGDETLKHYLDDQGIVLGVNGADIQSTREAFEDANLFYATKRIGINVLDSLELVPASSHNDLNYQADQVQIVSVLSPAK